ncbi:MAG: LrgB family protein [Sphaerochaetaceae bacterium]
MMAEPFTSPLFGFIITLLAYQGGIALHRRFPCVLLSPLLVAAFLIIVFLRLTGIPLADYNRGGDILTLLITPATTVLAVSVYNQRDLLRKNLLPICVGSLVGAATSVGSVLLMSRIFSLDKVLARSLLPKSVTNAIAVELSTQMGGIPSLTILAVLITGMTGVIAAPWLIRICRIDNPVSQGLATGACSHMIGTIKALEMGESQGAMSSIAICTTGIATVVIAQFL